MNDGPVNINLMRLVDYALMEAAYDGNLSDIRAAIAAGASEMFFSFHLEASVRAGRLENALFFLENGADVHVNGECCLFMAVCECDDALIRLLVRYGADFTRIDVNEALLSVLEHIDIVAVLLRSGADVNAGQHMNNAFVRAVTMYSKDSMDVVQLLFSHGVVEKHVNDALDMAVRWGTLDVVRFLFDRGADIRAVKPHTFSVIAYGGHGGRGTVMRFLIEQGADVRSISPIPSRVFPDYSTPCEIIQRTIHIPFSADRPSPSAVRSALFITQPTPLKGKRRPKPSAIFAAVAYIVEAHGDATRGQEEADDGQSKGKGRDVPLTMLLQHNYSDNFNSLLALVAKIPRLRTLLIK